LPPAAITIVDVAKRAGVSIKTVSRVLNREPNVREQTRERVIAAAAALSYTPNVAARSLAGSRSYLLGLLFDNPSLSYIGDMQMGALRECRLSGHHLIVEPFRAEGEDVGVRIRALIATLKTDGLILTPPVCDHPEVLAALDEAGVAYVRVAPYHDPVHGASVHMDDAAAARQMTELLIGLGHRKIAFILGHPEHGASQSRADGYAAALRLAGLPHRPELVRQGFFSFRSGVEAAEELLSGPDRPTAIFASNDDMALGVMSVANRLGLSVPRDLSIAGFDDTPSARVVWPQLTPVRQPIAEMGAAAAELLVERRAAAGGARLLEFEIVPRDSTGPAPGS
jgi:LacI family transcriptional regulator